MIVQAARQRLRSAETLGHQNKMEREVKTLHIRRQERTREVPASNVSRQLTKQVEANHRRIREHLASWQALHPFIQLIQS